jgi:hypothetical protein
MGGLRYKGNNKEIERKLFLSTPLSYILTTTGTKGRILETMILRNHFIVVCQFGTTCRPCD